MIEEIKKILKIQILPKVENGYYKIWCIPSINVGTSGEKKFIGQNNQKVSEWPEYPINFNDLEETYFKNKASKREVNCVEFIIEKGQISEIKEYWDEKIIEDFNANLPKSKRGKIKAWYDE